MVLRRSPTDRRPSRVAASPSVPRPSRSRSVAADHHGFFATRFGARARHYRTARDRKLASRRAASLAASRCADLVAEPPSRFTHCAQSKPFAVGRRGSSRIFPCTSWRATAPRAPKTATRSRLRLLRWPRVGARIWQRNRQAASTNVPRPSRSRSVVADHRGFCATRVGARQRECDRKLPLCRRESVRGFGSGTAKPPRPMCLDQAGRGRLSRIIADFALHESARNNAAVGLLRWSRFGARIWSRSRQDASPTVPGPSRSWSRVADHHGFSGTRVGAPQSQKKKSRSPRSAVRSGL